MGAWSCLEADVTEEAGAAAVTRAVGEAQVLVNGVGGFAGGHDVDATELAVWDRTYRLDLRSAVAVTRALFPAMRRRRRGMIAGVASRAALERPAGLAACAAAKAGLLVLTELLQREVEGNGVRACGLLPTTIDTPASRAAMPGADFSRWTPPRRIAEVVLWLASDAAAPLRGAVIPV
jgi:NAD(P)-dependent dehydrogenase (short-subunit alcohol dehydrogenase family)